MRTFFPILATAAALMIAATSCNLSVEEDYTFSYEVAYELQTQEQVDILKPYFEEFFTTHGNYTFHGEYYAAVEKSIEYFLRDSKDLDEAFIQENLHSSQDAVRLLLVIASNKVKNVTAFQTWVGEDKEEE